MVETRTHYFQARSFAEGDQPPRWPARAGWLGALALACLLAGFGYGAWELARHNLAVFTLHRDLIYPESAGIELARWTARDGRVFPHFQHSPYTPAIYGPLFYLALAAVEKLLRGHFFSLLLAARGASLAAFYGLAALVYVFSRRRGHGFFAALLAALALLAASDFSAWMVSARPDLPALFFTIFGLLLAAGISARTAAAADVAKRDDRRWPLVLAGSCCAAAWLLKQSFAAAPLAALIWLLRRGRRRDAGWFLAACAALPALFLTTLILRGEPALHELLLLRHSLMQPRQGLHILLAHLARPGNLALFILGALGALHVAFGRREPALNAARGQLLMIYFLLAWTLPVWPLMQCGGGANYLLEGWTACALLAPDGLAALTHAWAKIAPRSRMLILALLVYYTGWILLPRYRRPSYLQYMRNYGNLRPLRRWRVFSSDAYLTVHGRRPELLDPDLAHILSLTGHFDDAPIVARLRRQSYGLLFLGNWHGALPAYRGISYYSRAEIRAIRRHYSMLCATKGITVWLPRGRPALLHTSTAGEILNQRCVPMPLRLSWRGKYQLRAGTQKMSN